MEKELIQKAAIISDCEKYRYSLSRIWDREKEILMFIALNPSTADASKDDATTRRIQDFTEQWGYGGFYLLNLFAFRAKEPTDLFNARYPVSDPKDPEATDRYLEQISQICSKIIFCWGNDGAADNRCYQVQKIFPDAYSFGYLTMSGQPRHPLYLPKDTQLLPFTDKQPYIRPKTFNQ